MSAIFQEQSYKIKTLDKTVHLKLKITSRTFTLDISRITTLLDLEIFPILQVS